MYNKTVAFMDSISIVDITKVCRICLKENAITYSISKDVLEDRSMKLKPTRICEILLYVTNVKESDGFPELLCTKCVFLLQQAYKFKREFEHSSSILQTRLLQSRNEPKVETSEQKVVESDNDSKPVAEDRSDDADDLDEITETPSLYPCQNCTEEFSALDLREHTKSQKVVESDDSKPVAEDRSDDADDWDKITETPSLYPCPICTKEFSALDLREHAHSHKALRKYFGVNETVSRNTKFYVLQQPGETQVTLHQRTEKIHKCVLCNQEFTGKDLRQHIQSHRDQNNFKCDQCDRVFKKMNHLNTHRSFSHLKEYPFKCERCGKGFVIKKNYECHMLTHVSNQELPHKCNHCLRRFSNPEHLKRHMTNHIENRTYGNKYRVCKCHKCLRSFKDRSEMNGHQCFPVEQHLNNVFSCKLCNKMFKNSSSLYNHTRNIHKSKGAKTLCSVCGNCVSNIYSHMVRHKGERKFQCYQCGKSFLSKPQLGKHLLVHSGLKPFVCSMCAKAFNNLYNLQVHERIHKGDRCHICPICEKGFLEKSYLRKHMQVHQKVL